jgi:hypothetical protein
MTTKNKNVNPKELTSNETKDFKKFFNLNPLMTLIDKKLIKARNFKMTVSLFSFESTSDINIK